MANLISSSEVIEGENIFIVEVYDNGGTIKYVKPAVVVETTVRVITRYAFRTRFTTAEMVGLYTAAGADPVLKMFIDDVTVADNINLDEARVSEGLDYLVSQAIITAERKAEILS